MLNQFRIGNYTNGETQTGVTVIMADGGAVGGASIRGGAPASHETELLRAENTVGKINAVVLSGGSAFGLESTAGVMQYLQENGCGYLAGKYKVPIVVGAALYDLEYGAFDYPNKLAGYNACCASAPVTDYCGDIGAGTGATISKFGGIENAKKGGMAVVTGNCGNVEMAVAVAVNALGNIYDPQSGRLIAGMPIGDVKAEMSGNTTIACIITNAAINKAECNKLADVTQDSLAKCIRPSHTIFDGDSIFVMASGEIQSDMVTLQLLADRLCCEAILKAVHHN